MTASWPTSVHDYGPAHQDVDDFVLALHVNTLQEEVSAVQAYVGLNPHISTAPNSAGTFNAVSSVFSSLAARIANIETGVVADSHNQYLHLRGGDTILPSTKDVAGLKVRARTAQVAPLLRAESTDGSTAFLEVTTGGTTLSGLLSVIGNASVSGSQTVNGNVLLSGAAGTSRDVAFTSAGATRWVLRTTGETESGSTTGSNFQVLSRNDDGSLRATVLTLTRDTGVVNVGTELREQGRRVYSPNNPPVLIQPDQSLQNADAPFNQTGSFVDFLSASWAPVAITVPPSGKVRAHVSALVSNVNTPTATCNVGYRVSTTSGQGAMGTVQQNLIRSFGGQLSAGKTRLIDGLRPGDTVTLTPTWNISSGDNTKAQSLGGLLLVEPVY